MYIPPSNAEHDPAEIFGFIEANPFGALVTAGGEGLFATHLPLVLHREVRERGVLRGHVARANRHHRLEVEGEALVIFSGPQAYITPTWYPSKTEHGKVVPTWNYVAVHVYGSLRWTDDAGWLREHLAALSRVHEAGREHPWSLADAPEEYIAQQERAIVGVEIAIARMEGKWKMSQNRPAADIDGVVRGLTASERTTDREVGEIVRARKPGA